MSIAESQNMLVSFEGGINTVLWKMWVKLHCGVFIQLFKYTKVNRVLHHNTLSILFLVHCIEKMYYCENKMWTITIQDKRWSKTRNFKPLITLIWKEGTHISTHFTFVYKISDALAHAARDLKRRGAAGRGTNVGIGLFLRTLIWLMSHIIHSKHA